MPALRITSINLVKNGDEQGERTTIHRSPGEQDTRCRGVFKVVTIAEISYVTIYRPNTVRTCLVLARSLTSAALL